MAHRGRLNVLVNTFGKPCDKLFAEFEGFFDAGDSNGSGDVKYHLGARGEHKAPSGRTLRTTLACNPSHLEAVNPVVEGATQTGPNTYEGGVLTRADYVGVKPVFRHDHNERKDTINALGWNNKLNLGDWTAVADLSWSKAERDESILELYSGTVPGSVTGTGVSVTDPVTGCDGVPSPAEFHAVTRNSYGAPLRRLVTTTERLGPEASSTFTHSPPGERCSTR